MEWDSGSEASDAVRALPSDARIERQLRDVVRAAFKQQEFDDLTLKNVRAKATTTLSLPEDFLKTDKRWKEKSKEIVRSEVVGSQSS